MSWQKCISQKDIKQGSIILNNYPDYQSLQDHRTMRFVSHTLLLYYYAEIKEIIFESVNLKGAVYN